MIRSRHIPGIFMLLAALGIVACTNHEPPKSDAQNLIARDTFVQVLTEVHLIEGVKKQRLMRDDEQGLIILQHYVELFDRFDVNEERFKSTYQWWYQHPAEMDGLLEEVSEALSELERATNASH
ncbi:MAG: DUF4296 domain-containing protein [Crocinitomicaceae bacterium]|jgi:hypothetical protein|nr:DUF4296 domain-containing protein [Crocinitomicaceae bacterium]